MSEHAHSDEVDLLVVGGGINGAGIARDAAGRGLSVALCDQGDFAGGTSSASTKLIHGGLRYLEQFEFRLVAESLAEREALKKIAAHLVRPLRFVMPHTPQLRPAWMIRAGLFLYDHLGGLYDRDASMTLPGSTQLDLAGRDAAYAAPLQDKTRTAFAYSDLAVDDARLVIANLRSAARHGAQILPRQRLLRADRRDQRWHATLACVRSGSRRQISAGALVNAAGPWVMEVLGESHEVHAGAGIRLVKGSHLILPRLYDGEHAYLLQNDDRRIVFLIPYREHFTLLGTTDTPVATMAGNEGVSEVEIDYLLAAANRYLRQPPTRQMIHGAYWGFRPLYDDGKTDPSAITRDYTLYVDEDQGAPYVAIFGGKLTTYRRLAETVLQRLAPRFATARGPWTRDECLPGSEDFAGSEAALAELHAAAPWLDPPYARALIGRYGRDAAQILGRASAPAQLGRRFAGELSECEVAWLVANEWAREADDILDRRTKAGLFMDAKTRSEFAEWFASGGYS
jgi:glycerol-3-phosphate dehydrogenase